MLSKQNLTVLQSLVYMNSYTLLHHGNAETGHGLGFESSENREVLALVLSGPHR